MQSAALRPDHIFTRDDICHREEGVQLLRRQTPLHVLFIVENQQRDIFESLILHCFGQLSLRYLQPFLVSGVDHEHEPVDFVVVVLPQFSGFPSYIPQCDLNPLRVELLNVQPDGRHSLFEFVVLEPIQHGGLA